MNTPLIKWTGSKRSVAKQIVDFFPNKIETYYEPFLGGGSVFLELLKSSLSVNRYECSDFNESLIEIFKSVKNNPDEIINSYDDKWNKLQNDKDYFYKEREYYNNTKDPFSLYFLTRTCYNGTIRYNNKGEFNTSYHFGRSGMQPEKIEKIIQYYNLLMKNKSINFSHKSFLEVKSDHQKDVVYIDPPYSDSKALYFGNINFNNLCSWIEDLPCNWYFNFNEINSKDTEAELPFSYSGKEELCTGKSSFSRMKGIDVNVREYFYYKSI